MNTEHINSDIKVERDEITLKDIILKIIDWWHYLLSKWLVLMIFGILGGILGYFYAKNKTLNYIAATTFVLEDSGSNASAALGSLGGIASIAGINLGGGEGIFQGDNIVELYKSRTMIEKTLLSEVEYNGKKELLIDRYIDFNNMREKWSENHALKAVQFKQSQVFTRLQDSILGSIVNDINRNYLKVEKPDKQLSIIRAEIKAPDEFFAKAFNDQIVKNVNDFYVQTKTKKSLENVTILQQKVDSVRSVMNGAIYSAAAVADATPNLNLTRQVQRIAPIQRSQFTAETNKSILSELVKNLELSKMSLRKETPLIQVIDGPVFPLDKIYLNKLKGLILGGLLGGFLVCLFLVFKRLLKSILA